MSSAAARIPLPERERRYRIALTPLADAMFQLLIFFMLSSGLTPYSMLTLSEGQAESTENAGSAPQESTPPEQGGLLPDGTALWSISAESVTIRGQVFEFAILSDLARAMADANPEARVILVVEDGATVQTVSTVLEALSTAEITSIQLSRIGRGG